MDEKTIFERVQRMLHEGDDHLLEEPTVGQELSQELESIAPVVPSPFQVSERVTYKVPVIRKEPFVLEAEAGRPCPFRIGQTVFYKIPVNITRAGRYDWGWHQGTVCAIHPDLEMVTLFPTDEGGEWRMHPWCYTQEARPDVLV
jgi:hypothetical protein